MVDIVRSETVSTTDFRVLPGLRVPDHPRPLRRTGKPSSRIPKDHTACWQLLEAYKRGDVTNLSRKEHMLMRAYARSDHKGIEIERDIG